MEHGEFSFDSGEELKVGDKLEILISPAHPNDPREPLLPLSLLPRQDNCTRSDKESADSFPRGQSLVKKEGAESHRHDNAELSTGATLDNSPIWSARK